MEQRGSLPHSRLCQSALHLFRGHPLVAPSPPLMWPLSLSCDTNLPLLLALSTHRGHSSSRVLFPSLQQGRLLPSRPTQPLSWSDCPALLFVAPMLCVSFRHLAILPPNTAGVDAGQAPRKLS